MPRYEVSRASALQGPVAKEPPSGTGLNVRGPEPSVLPNMSRPTVHFVSPSYANPDFVVVNPDLDGGGTDDGGQ